MVFSKIPSIRYEAHLNKRWHLSLEANDSTVNIMLSLCTDMWTMGKAIDKKLEARK